MHIVADDGPMLVRAVVIRRDGSRAVVDVAAHRCIPDIREMVRLGAVPERARLDLDEITDVDFVIEFGART